MKITVEIELNKDEPMLIRTCSLERVLNNAINVGSRTENHDRVSQDLRERASSLWQDCDALKPVVTKIWNAVSEAVFVELQKEKTK